MPLLHIFTILVTSCSSLHCMAVTIFIYMLWSQLDPEIAGKVQVCPFLLFLVNSGSEKGTTRGQCRDTLAGAFLNSQQGPVWETGSTTIHINKFF